MATPIPFETTSAARACAGWRGRRRMQPKARRLLMLATIYDGGSRTEAVKVGSVTVQIVGDRVVRFNDRGLAGLVNGKAPGSPSKLDAGQRQAFAKIVESGPIPAIHGVVRWRRKDLVQWIFEEFAISLDESSCPAEAWGLTQLSCRNE